MEGRLLRAVQGRYQDSEAAVRVGDDEMNCFEVESNVRQQCPILPWLSTAIDTDSVAGSIITAYEQLPSKDSHVQ